MRILLTLGLSLMLAACSGLSLASKADAAYGSFVASEQAGATLIQSPAVSDSVKAGIQAADAKAKPAADALLAAILAYRTSPANADALQHALDIALPAITTLATETAK